MGHVPWQTVTLPQGNFKWIKTVYIKSYYITCVLHEAYVLRCSGPLKTSGWIIRRDVLRWKLRANCQGRKERRTVWPSEGRAENFGLSIENIQHLMVNHHFPFEMAMIGGYTPCSNRPISSCFNLLEFLYRKWPNPLVPWSNPTTEAGWNYRSPNQMAIGGKYANLSKPKYHIISKLVPIGYVSVWFYRHCCPINIINAGQVTLWQSNMVCRKTTHLVGWFSRLTAHSVPGFPSLFDYQEGKPNCCLYTIIPHWG